MVSWEIVSLELDSGGMDAGEHLQNSGFPIRRISGEEVDKLQDATDHLKYPPGPLTHSEWFDRRETMGKKQMLEIMRLMLPVKPTRYLVVHGSGYHHHLTYGLAAIASRHSDSFCYVHVDAHTDCRNFIDPKDPRPREYVEYSNFVGDLRLDATNNAKDLIMIGSFLGGQKGMGYAPHKLFKDKLNSQEALGDLEAMLAKTKPDVYLSFDLDVLCDEEMRTDWSGSQGNLTKEQLLRMVALIKSKKRIVGADILGFNYSNNLLVERWVGKEQFIEQKNKSLLVYADLVSAITN